MMIKRLVLSLLCVLSLSANAQPIDTDPSEQLSDAYIRSALTFLTYAEALDSNEPQVLAAALLDEALRLNPGNAQAWAMRAELAQAAGDLEAYENALIAYLETGVDDDRARFNLIRHRLSTNNDTLDAQLHEVENLLNSDAGRSLSAPLRSRLASLACSFAGEMLDERARRRWAVEAARADPANLIAAQTMLDLVIELDGDEIRRGTAMVNIVRANPVDPAPRLALAGLLAEQGAYDRAAQQYKVASTRLSPEPLHISDYTRWAQCLAMSGQDVLLLQLLDELEAALNQAPEPPADPRLGTRADQPSQEPEQDKVALPLPLELIRLAVLRDSDDPDQAQVVFDRIAAQLRASAAEAEDTAQAHETKRNLALIAAIFGPDPHQAEQAADEAGDDAVALGWVTLRRGDPDRASQIFRAHADEKPLAACGLALATGTDDAGRARLLQQFIDSSSTGSLAALAAGRELQRIQKPAQPTTSGKSLLALMAKFPESFWLVDLERTPWINIRLKINPPRIKPLEPVNAEITLWNTSRFPLAVTENGPLHPNAVIMLNATTSGRQLPPSSPIVVDLGRRLSLKAGERVIVDTRLDYHQFGSLRAANPGTPLSFDARLILNPQITPFGTWQPSGIGAMTEVRDSLIESHSVTDQTIEAWLKDLEGDMVPEKIQAMHRIAGLHRGVKQTQLTVERIEQLTIALRKEWDAGSEVDQAWLTVNAVTLEDPETTYPDLLSRAMQSKSKLVWLALIVRHATEVDSDILKAAMGRQDMPDIARFAERQRRMLRDYDKYLEEQAKTDAGPSQ